SHERLSREPQQLQVQGDATRVSAWLEGMMHERITVPTPERYRLEGALLDSLGGQPAGHILYRQSNERSMSLVIWRGEVPTADLAQRDKGGAHFQVGTYGTETIVFWREGDLTYACVGDESSDAMLEFAALIRHDETN